jgi:ankyrin repeat protein
MSGLLAAASAGNLRKIQRLLKKGASIHEIDEIGRNALMHAVINSHTYGVLKVGKARISDATKGGKNALSFTLACGRYGIVQWLLEEGSANITATVVLENGEHYNVWEQFNSTNLRVGYNRYLNLRCFLAVLFPASWPSYRCKTPRLQHRGSTRKI